MPTRVLKYMLMEMDHFGPNTIKMPASARIRHTDIQASPYGLGVMAWAEVVTLEFHVDRTFLLIATGEPVPDSGEYMKTIEFPSGTIWHLYEIKE